MLSLNSVSHSKKLNSKRKSPGYILASTVILLFIILASLSVVLQYTTTLSSSIRQSSQTHGALNAASAGMTAAANYLDEDPSALKSSTITPNSPCADGSPAVNQVLGTSLTLENTFRVTGSIDSRGAVVTSERETKLGPHSFKSTLKTNILLVNTNISTAQPKQITQNFSSNAKDFSSIATHDPHSCYLAGDGEIYYWGLNSKYQLGDGTLSPKSVPTKVNRTGAFALQTIQSIHVGYEYTCTLTTSGQIWCWGSNEHGQLGRGTVTTREQSPVRVTEGSRAQAKTHVH